MNRRFLLIIFVASVLPVSVWAAATDEFERKIRPVLIDKCISCHGPKKQESGLRLDSRQALLRGGDRGPAVNLKMPAKSLLLKAIVRRGDLKMPPKGSLSNRQINDFRRWISKGMTWPANKAATTRRKSAKNHWAFQPIRRPMIPRTRFPQPGNAIDAFVASRHKRARLTFARPASRRELIRRLSFDLLGLPPTPADVAAFLSDKSPQAYERLIDRLLASPRYGEKWGRHWLDVARYADNRGYVFFIGKNFPWSYTYRDYVIRAWNEDLPYDRFILEQLAADLLDLGKDRRPLAGMGLLTVGAAFMNNVHDVTDDRIDVIARGLMAITVSCARCHDHKFDPIPQADYYSLYGVLRSSEEPLIPPLLETPAKTKTYEKFAKELAKRSKDLDSYIRQRYQALVTGARKRVSEYLMAVYRQQDQPDQDDFMLLVNTNEVNPTMVIRWRHYLRKQSEQDPVWAPWLAFRRLPAERFSEQAQALTKKLSRQQINPLVRQYVLQSPPKSLAELADRYGKLFVLIDQRWTSAKKAKPSLQALTSGEEEVKLHIYGKHAPPTVTVKVGWGFLTIFPDRATQGEFKKRRKALEDWIERGPGAPPRAMSLAEAKVPFQPRIFLRGNAHRQGKEVPRQFLKLLSPPNRRPFAKGSGRLEMAKSIATAENPLTARVIVNRVWQHHFGQGLVTTPSDFGLRSSPPSHPLLLDYLATWLIDHDWSIKSLHRLILCSATYRQSSDYSSAFFEKDPTNKWLWRFNRRRLDFESLRDSLLSVAGELNLKIGGKPIELHAGGKLIPRRSIYGFINRMDVSALMTTFDFPSPVATSPGRVATTVAPQALYFMNNPLVRVVSERVVRRLGNVAIPIRANRLYQLLLSRNATTDELAMIRKFLGKRPDEKKWAKFAQALLMTNEFIFVD